MPASIANHVALVTGASRGLGAAIAAELAARGAAVAVNYFASPQKANAVVEQIQRKGGRAQAFAADVRDESQIRGLFDAIKKQLGAVDILVVNATGDQPFLGIEDLTWKSFQDQLDFFVKSPLFLAQAVLPEMKKRRWGRIIQIGSEVFSRGVPQFSAYVAAKGAQLGLTRSWALELAAWNITVNLVAPGWVPTERHANVPRKEIDKYAAGVPMKRVGTAQEVAEAVAYLASEGAGFVTGQKLSVNGGHSLD